MELSNQDVDRIVANILEFYGNPPQ